MIGEANTDLKKCERSMNFIIFRASHLFFIRYIDSIYIPTLNIEI